MNQRVAHLIETLQFWPQRQYVLLSDLLSLLKDGVQLNQAITTLCAIYKGVSRHVAQQMAEQLSKGHSLAAGMQGWYPITLVEIIRAGEEGGMFISALEAAVAYYKERVVALKMVLQSMLYPIIVLVVAMIMLVVIKTSVLANFATIKAIAEWPPIGRQLYDLANFIEYGWWFAAFLLLAAIVGIFYLLQNFTGALRKQIDCMPILGLYRRLTAARFMETLGLLVTNGVGLKEALAIIRHHAGPYLAWHVMLMEYHLSGGKENIADVLDTQLIHYDDLIRLRVMATGKGFGAGLVSLGRQALQRYGQSVAITAKVMGGMLLCVGALLAAMMVLGIYSIGSVVAS